MFVSVCLSCHLSVCLSVCVAVEGGRWRETGVGGGRRGSEMGEEGETGGVPVPVSVPVVSKIQVEYSTCSSILRIFCQYELDYRGITSLLCSPTITTTKESTEEGGGIFHPEGPLGVDCRSLAALQELYDPEGGGCFLVATAAVRNSPRAEGTAGLVIGTRVQYPGSGTPFSGADRLTASIRGFYCRGPPSD